MDIFLEAHKQFIILLQKHQVDFMLIGGYAVIIYGYERGTGDLDIWLKPTNSNKAKFIQALREHGVLEVTLNIVNGFDFEGDARAMNIGIEPNRIDFLTKVHGVVFDEVYPMKMMLPLKDFQVPIIRYEDLITMKMLTDRLKDKADVEELQKINRYRKHE